MSIASQNRIADVVSMYAQEYPISRAYLFGSYARGDADASSDVDICIESGEGFTLFNLGGFANKLEAALGCKVDIVCDEDSFYPRAKKRYLADRVMIYAQP